MEGIGILIVIVAVIWIISVIAKKSKKKNNNSLELTDNPKLTINTDKKHTVSVDKPKLTINMDKKPVMKSSPKIFNTPQNNDENHKVTRIMLYESNNVLQTWTCEYCESENSNSFEKCNVCNHYR